MALAIVFGAFTTLNAGTINASILKNQDEEVSANTLKEFVALVSYKNTDNMFSNTVGEQSSVYRSL